MRAAIQNLKEEIPQENPVGGSPGCIAYLHPHHLSLAPTKRGPPGGQIHVFVFFMLSNSPSLHVAFQEVGITLLGCFVLTILNLAIVNLKQALRIGCKQASGGENLLCFSLGSISAPAGSA